MAALYRRISNEKLIGVAECGQNKFGNMRIINA